MNLRETFEAYNQRRIGYRAVEEDGQLRIKREGEAVDGSHVLASGDVVLRRAVPFIGGWTLYSVSAEFSGLIGNQATTRAFMSTITRKAAHELGRH